MGEARKRRLALTKGGKADIAKTQVVAPERLTNLTIQMPTLRANIASEIYTQKVDKKTCPTPNDFWLAVFDAGMIEFERFYITENEKPAVPDISIDPAIPGADHTPEEGGEGG